jgi:hypothetical protein
MCRLLVFSTVSISTMFSYFTSSSKSTVKFPRYHLESFEQTTKSGVNSAGASIRLNQVATGDHRIDPSPDKFEHVQVWPTEQTVYRVTNGDSSGSDAEPLPDFISVHGTVSYKDEDGSVEFPPGPVDLYFARPDEDRSRGHRQSTHHRQWYTSTGVSVNPSGNLTICVPLSKRGQQHNVLDSCAFQTDKESEAYKECGRGASSSVFFRDTRCRETDWPKQWEALRPA